MVLGKGFMRVSIIRLETSAVRATTHIDKKLVFAAESAIPAHKRSNAQTAQRALASISVVFPSFRNGRNEVKENSNAPYRDETLSEGTPALVGATNRIRVQDIIDPYQISQTRLKAQYPRWSMNSALPGMLED